MGYMIQRKPCGCGLKGNNLSKNKLNRGKTLSKSGKKSLKSRNYRGGFEYEKQFKSTLSPCYDNTPKVGWHAGGSKEVNHGKPEFISENIPGEMLLEKEYALIDGKYELISG